MELYFYDFIVGGESSVSGICPTGFYCPSGTRIATEFGCPNGTYNDVTGLSFNEMMMLSTLF
jgi:hypothetical protein